MTLGLTVEFMTVGTLLRKLRDSRKLSTRAVAEMIDVSHSTYISWEHDKSSISLRHYLKIAEAFHIDPIELMAYLIQRVPYVVSQEEKNSVRDLKEMLVYYQNYSQELKSERDRLQKELNSIVAATPLLHSSLDTFK